MESRPSRLVSPMAKRRLFAVLLVAVVASSVAVEYSSFRSRQLFSKLQDLKNTEYELQVEWGKLLLEQSTLGAHGNIEKVAREQLDMVSPEPEDIRVVKP